MSPVTYEIDEDGRIWTILLEKGFTMSFQTLEWKDRALYAERALRVRFWFVLWLGFVLAVGAWWVL